MSVLKTKENARKLKSLLLIFLSLVLVTISSPSVFAQETKGGNKSGAKKAPKEKLKSLDSLKVPGLKFSEKIPSNFPMPEYPRNVLKKSFVHSTKGNPSATASMITKDSAQVVFRWYQAVCKRGGWKVRVPQEQTVSTGTNSKMYMLDAAKGHNSISISCYKCMDPTFTGTSINISWTFIGK